MKKLGFKEFLDDSHDGYIITSYHFPTHPNFNFTAFYQKLSDKGRNIVTHLIHPNPVLSLSPK